MPDIYDEAVADKKKLLAIAETNAKNKIVDAVTPRIKELVESALLGKLNEELGDDDILIDVGLEGDVAPPDEIAPPVEPLSMQSVVEPAAPPTDVDASIDVASGDDAGMTLPDQDGKIVLDVDAFLSGGDDIPTSSTQFELTPESIKALSALVGTNVCDLNAVNERLLKMESRLNKLVKNVKPSLQDIEQARQIKLECEHIYGNVQASRDVLDEVRVVKVEGKLEKIFQRVMEHYSALGHLTLIVKEMHDINVRAGKLFKTINESRRTTGVDVEKTAQMLREVKVLHEIVGKLYESLGKDDSIDAASVQKIGANLAALYTEIRNMVTKKKRIVEADELDVGAGAAAGVADDAGMDLGMDDGMEADDAEMVLLQLELPASLSGAGPESVQVVGMEPAGADDDMDGLDDMGMDDADANADADMDMDDEMDEADEMQETKLQDDDIIEIDEAALVAEMKKMKKLREKKKVGTAGIKNVNTGGHGPAHFDNFGGGKEDGEKFVDGEDLNAHDPVGSEGYLDEGADIDESDMYEGEEDLDEADLEETDSDEEDLDESDAVEESRSRNKAGRTNRQSKEKQLAEAVKKARTELADQKLFNTKLVALNRVLQIPGLKQGQKEKVVEILDKGKTVAEVKQLYGKIVESLKKGRKTVTESTQPVARGSASRATTSGASKAGDETHPLLEKWQKIAFGGGGLIQG